MWGTGHAWTYGNTSEQRADNAADLLSFLVKVLGLDGRGALPGSESGSSD